MAADSQELFAVFERLQVALKPMRFGSPVTHVYNPLLYAGVPFRQYLERYVLGPPGRTFLLGMNPGPWGMAQTGVPFGEVGAVRNWLGIEGPVGQPEHIHPARPILGYDCARSEVSGRRVWGLFEGMYPKAQDFAQNFVVINYCPLVFMEESGRNRTPDKLPKQERELLYQACDSALKDLILLLKVEHAIGIGRFALQRLQSVVSEHSLGLTLDTILHPSPANPQANKDWAGRVLPVLELAKR